MATGASRLIISRTRRELEQMDVRCLVKNCPNGIKQIIQRVVWSKVPVRRNCIVCRMASGFFMMNGCVA